MPNIKLKHIVNELLLVESLNNARLKYLNTNLITEKIFNLLIYFDPTKNKQYIEWMCKQYLNTDNEFDFENIYTTTNKLITLSGQLKNFDNLKNEKQLFSPYNEILYYKNIKQFTDLLLINIDKNSKRIIDKTEKINYSIIKSNNDYRIIKPNTYECAKKYGGKTNWCISTDNKTWWDKYTSEGVIYYFIIPNETNAFIELQNELNEIKTFIRDIDVSKMSVHNENNKFNLVDSQQLDLLPYKDIIYQSLNITEDLFKF